MSGPTMGAAIAARLEALAALTDEPGKITRLYLSPAHRKAADLVLRWMGEAGMESGIGPLGDAIGRYEASSPGAKTLILGSHVDSVRDAGRYDGCLGVATAVEIVARLHRDGRRLPFAIEVVAFGDEEGVRFPATLGGSRALAGRFDPACLDERDAGGVTRRAALGAFGVDPDPSKIAALALDPAATLGYVEVHIEQGPVLETEGLALAAVTGIAGATRARIELDGVAGHAGTVPMKLRRDALAGVAAAVLAVEARARADDAVVATVGTLEIAGGAPNTVPGRVAFSLDLRSPDDARRRAAVADVEAAIASIAAARGLLHRIERRYEAAAVQCDRALVARLERALAKVGAPPRRMTSGAGHDAMAFDGRIPFAMLFVRCKGGVSHNPAESASAEDIDLAARALAAFVEDMAAEPAAT